MENSAKTLNFLQPGYEYMTNRAIFLLLFIILIPSFALASDGGAGFFIVALPIIFGSWLLAATSSLVYFVWSKGGLVLTSVLLLPAMLLFIVTLASFINWQTEGTVLLMCSWSVALLSPLLFALVKKFITIKATRNSEQWP